jgi:hypothetical protein
MWKKARSGGSFVLKQGNNSSVKELNDSDDVHEAELPLILKKE